MEAIELILRQEQGIFAGMTRSALKKAVFFLVLAVAGLVSARFALRSESGTGDQFADKANLALRRTAHLLLVKNGDSTSTIAPVQSKGDGIFLLHFERSFRYEFLPGLLQESLNLHGIKAKYDVGVRDCIYGDLVLGYSSEDLKDISGPPCGSREQPEGCYDMQVTFALPEKPVPKPTGWLLAAGFIAGIFSYGLWRSLKKNQPAPPANAPDDPQRLHFGGSSLDLGNQMLTAGTARHSLTYRETKLLNLFVSHPNQLLERDFILQAVWKDEGIIVGRSVDVFVSRLRKLLRDDPSVRIVTQHGVGYRLEVG